MVNHNWVEIFVDKNTLVDFFRGKLSVCHFRLDFFEILFLEFFFKFYYFCQVQKLAKVQKYQSGVERLFHVDV